MILKRNEVTTTDLDAWCSAHLHCGVERVLFRAGNLSTVIGTELTSGQGIVVKIREAAARLTGCAMVHRNLFDQGFPCPEPLVELQPFGEDVASAESLVEGGALFPDSGREAAPFAQSLARLMSLSPPVQMLPGLDPPPPWTAPDHHEPGLWPPADDHDGDLNAIAGPTWVDDAGRRVRERLLGVTRDRVIGHGDWYTGNLRWEANRLFTAWDWDSVIVANEPLIAGLAAAAYPTTTAGTESTTEESEQFLRVYEAARGKEFDHDELEEAWAAGLWNRVFDAKKQYAVEGRLASLEQDEVRDRLERAGLL